MKQNLKETLTQEVLSNDSIRMSLAEWLRSSIEAMSGGVCSLSAVEIAALIERPPDQELGDFALPCFRFARETKKRPEEVSAALVANFHPKDSSDSQKVEFWVASLSTHGAFLNIKIKSTSLATYFLNRVFDQTHPYFEVFRHSETRRQARVMIEHSQPNTHKEFHVGHTRNVCLGDSLVRLFRYCGYTVIAANYPGDEGTHIAKCLWYIRSQAKEAPEQRRGAWLGQMYAEASKTISSQTGEIKENTDREVSGILRAIEERQGEIFEQWKLTRQWSLENFYEIYRWLGVSFDHYFFESELSAESQAIVEEYYQKGVFILSEGAIGIELKDFKLGFLLLRKRDGNTLYATKDLALARRKFKDFGVKRSLYVVAHEQNLHFKQVFKTLELMGFEQSKDCFHLSYGMVVLPEGKMSSRDGNTFSFSQLSEAVSSSIRESMAKHSADWDEAELSDTVRRLSAGAIRYGMVGTDPAKNVVFNVDDWVSFDGDSGPYMMYSYARIKSILRKAVEGGFVDQNDVDACNGKRSDFSLLTDKEESQLLLHLYDFPKTVVAACEQYKPSLLAHFLFQSCQNFNRMYAKLSVLKAETAELRLARLSLLVAFSNILKEGLDLLGIEPPERM